VKSPSQCPIPDDAPDWTYKPDFQTATTTVHVSQTDHESTVHVSQTDHESTVHVSQTDHGLSTTQSSGTPQRNPTGGSVARQIFSDTADHESSTSSSSESSSSSDSDSD